MTIINIIEKNKRHFSKSELKVADYVIQHPSAIEQYTIIKIAELSNTSKSAVLRFCQKMNYKGYSEFRYEMVRYLHSDNVHVIDVNPIDHLISTYVRAVVDLKNIKEAQIIGLVNSIRTSSSLFSFGIYKSGLAAQKLVYNLIDCGKQSTLINDLVSLSHTEFILDSNSLLLIFSVSGSGKELGEFLKTTKKINYDSFLITFNTKAPLSKLVKNTLYVPASALVNEEHLDENALLMIVVEIITKYYLLLD